MARISYICKKCNKTKKVSFKPGEKHEDPACDECNELMIRDFNNVGIGEIESDTMSNIKVMMKNSQSFTGKDKRVY